MLPPQRRDRWQIQRILCVCMFALAPSAHAIERDFEREVAPLIVLRCLECHNPVNPSGGLDLSSYQSMVQGGESGSPIAAEVETSLLLKRVVQSEMPPEKNGKSQALTVEEQLVLKEWIASKAPWPTGRVLDLYERTTAKRAGRDWWAWQPIAQSPAANSATLPDSIDTIIGDSLKPHSLTPSPQADRRTLLRRLSFDLIGLPPTSEEISVFEQDDAPNAYEKIVDQLLASKHFGERWARHWLDLARFAETNGYERDEVKPYAWRYRDWVVDAIKSDMPHDQFVTEQLAGDEIPGRTQSSVIATGFLRLGTWDDEPNDPNEYQYDRLEDMVHTTTTAFLAMTVKCARCHDHKFDAIPQTDYYRVASSFWGGPIGQRNREWNGGPSKDELGFDVLGWTDLTRNPTDLRLLVKGDVQRPLQVVAPGTLTGVPGLARVFDGPPPNAKTSTRRLQLAHWIVDKRNPLTARVAVNRLWQHHFGEGLVRTPDNFGFLGSPPTNPELLDLLASELMAGEWRLKRIHKMIVMSKTYCQSSVHPLAKSYMELDAANRFWWRAERRRLDSEQLRDALLFCSGRLDRSMGGPSFKAPINEEALEGLSKKGEAYKASTAEESRRRSIYMFSKRSLAVPMMVAFDSCDTTAPTGKRDVSTVAPQALTLLNNEWVHGESQAMAARVLASSSDREQRVLAAWRMVLSREPTDREKVASMDFVSRWESKAGSDTDSELLAFATLCHTLVNTNEFIYLD